MNDEIWEKIFNRIREDQFYLGITERLSWFYIARNLKHAADRLFDIYYKSNIKFMNKLVEEFRSENI